MLAVVPDRDANPLPGGWGGEGLSGSGGQTFPAGGPPFAAHEQNLPGRQETSAGSGRSTHCSTQAPVTWRVVALMRFQALMPAIRRTSPASWRLS